MVDNIESIRKILKFDKFGEFYYISIMQRNKDGVKVYTTDVVVEDQEFAESKSSSGMDGGFAGSSSFSGGRPEPMAAGDGFMNIPDGIDEELPFN